MLHDVARRLKIDETSAEAAMHRAQLDFLATHTGLSHEELLAGLGEHLPKAIDHLTPDCRMPTPDEMTRAV